jgi:hypothetical protein
MINTYQKFIFQIDKKYNMANIEVYLIQKETVSIESVSKILFKYFALSSNFRQVVF